MTPARLAAPSAWRPRRTRRFVLLMAWGGLCVTVLLVGGALAAFVGGSEMVAIAVLLVATCLPLQSAAMWHAIHARKKKIDGASIGADDVQPRLTIRYCRHRPTLTLLATVALTVGAWPLSVVVWVNGSEFWGVCVGFLGLVGVGGVVHVLCHALPPGELSLSPDGIRLREGGHRHAAAWDDVRAVVPYDYSTDNNDLGVWRSVRIMADHVAGWTKPGWWSNRKRGPGASRPGIAIECDAIDIDSVLLYHMLRFYHEQPLARAELGTDQSLVRLRDGVF